MLKRFVVRKNQRGLLLREGDFVRVMEPGVSWMADPFKRLSLQICDLAAPLFDGPLADWLRQNDAPAVARWFERMDLSEDEAGLRYENDLLVEIMAPGSRRLYWQGPLVQRLERVALADGFVLPTALAR